MRTDAEIIKLPSLDGIPDHKFHRLAQKRIFFGHQSVGFNILDGMAELAQQYENLQLNIVETRTGDPSDGGIFAHCRIGKNMDPLGKIQDFVQLIDSAFGENTDIAFLKFCYVDIHEGTDIPSVFQHYQTAIEELQARHPWIKFIHFCVPLFAPPNAITAQWKQTIKSILGKTTILKDNEKRDEYNHLLKNAYAESEIFDLARFESIDPMGRRVYWKKAGKTIPLLHPQFTTDGGHLNEEGKKRVAEQFLLFLMNSIRNQ